MFCLSIIFKLLKLYNFFFYNFIYFQQLKLPFSCDYRGKINIIIEPNASISIGQNVFFNTNCSLNSMCNISIGDHTIFGENVKIYDHNHKYSLPNVPIKQQGYTTAPVNIGRNCWIGSNVIILKGVSIGDHCVIGAGCIIYKDIPANSVVINKQNLEIKSSL